ncbi:phage antirepressor [Mycobacteroides chelonae]|uniref:phage antirepressor n=1 Tax=Mycobacteroides chelonae TaxID=1774 RepID=UPI0008A9C50D|nr:phage antirepressor KilAC domain-containing protein [Mycobacteroides chelonae]AYM43170.1 hypothetical protein DYE20_17965 [[Mycobacterium] chelonae subsp. gwanakae]OHU14529.1 hypothetical protein BKG75_04605 [Mycobacteroides chelonae]
MSTDIQLFEFRDYPVRFAVIDGEPHPVLADLCAVLDISNPRNVAARLADDQRGAALVDTPYGRRSMTVVNESGMYEVIFRSDKPEAVEFRRFVTGTVLPQIRKTGQYGTAAVVPLTRLEYARKLVDAEERVEAESRARIEAELRARELEAPASAWSHMADATGDYGVADAAKVLSRDPNINIGRDRLFRFMAVKGWIYRDRGTASWKAYQTQVDCGRLVEKLNTPYLHQPSGEMRVPPPTIRITPKGLAELHKRLGGAGQLVLMAASA